MMPPASIAFDEVADLIREVIRLQGRKPTHLAIPPELYGRLKDDCEGCRFGYKPCYLPELIGTAVEWIDMNGVEVFPIPTPPAF